MDLDEKNLIEPDPDNSAAVTKYQTKVDQGSHRELHSSFEPDHDDRIDRLLWLKFCSRLQKAIPVEVPTVRQTLSKIIRNVIEHPNNVKFRKLRKANPQFQRNVANYTDFDFYNDSYIFCFCILIN